MPSPATLQKSLQEGFKAKTGLDINIGSGTTGELVAKLQAEKNDSICDVLILASWSEGLSVKKQIAMESYTPVNGDKVNANFKEESNSLWGTSASAVGILYNPSKFTEDEIANLKTMDWADFGDSTKFDSTKHPFGIPDPTLSGASKDFVAGLVTRNNDDANNQKILDSWVSNGIVNSGKNGPALKDLKGGKIDVLLGGVDYNVYMDKDFGKTVDMFIPSSGTVVNPRPAGILKSSKHKIVAKKFMDYLLSDEAQKLVADEMLLPGRDDVKANDKRSQLKDIKQFDNLDWEVMSTKNSTIAQNLVDAIKNRK